MASLIEALENQELMEKLRRAGHGEIMEILLNNTAVYTKKGRLNKSGACRVLGWKTKQLEDELEACRLLLERDFLD